MLEGYKNIHFVGIGGSGMSAIALILIKMGFQVSGSDLSTTEMTKRLESLGAMVYIGHKAEHINNAEAIVISTAIPSTNPEVMRAREKGITIFHRADIVAQIMKERRGIAVAGAHGKTTTTSMIAIILEKAGLDPTVIIGGEVDDFGGNAKLGSGEELVAEADESDGSFLKLSPQIAVVTNIENDHMDYYGTMENILHTFETFLKSLPDNGLAVLCFDNTNLKDVASKINKPISSYAIDTAAEYMAKNIRLNGIITTYDVFHQDQFVGTIVLNVPGKHNVLNSLAAVVVAIHLGIPFDQIAMGLSLFHGAKRRFQTKGMINGVWVIDDYAHHPTEIKTTLMAAAQTKPQRLICVFQPHRYSRTQLLHEEFGTAFTEADLLILTEIYAAGEQPIPGVNGQIIEEEVKRQTNQKVQFFPERKEVATYLADIAKPGDMVITMGAGNIYLTGEELVEFLSR